MKETKEAILTKALSLVRESYVDELMGTSIPSEIEKYGRLIRYTGEMEEDIDELLGCYQEVETISGEKILNAQDFQDSFDAAREKIPLPELFTEQDSEPRPDFIFWCGVIAAVLVYAVFK